MPPSSSASSSGRHDAPPRKLSREEISDLFKRGSSPAKLLFRPNGVLATGAVRPPGVRAESSSELASKPRRRARLAPAQLPPVHLWPPQDMSEYARKGDMRVHPSASASEWREEQRRMQSLSQGLVDSKASKFHSLIESSDNEFAAARKLPSLLGRRFAARVEDKAQGIEREMQFRGTVMRLKPPPVSLDKSPPEEPLPKQADPAVVLEWRTESHHKVQLIAEGKNAEGGARVSSPTQVMTRRKRAMAGMAKDAVPGGRDGLLARLEHAKVQMDHLARATKAEEARRARKAGGNVERGRALAELDRLLGEEGEEDEAEQLSVTDVYDSYMKREPGVGWWEGYGDVSKLSPAALALRVLHMVGLDTPHIEGKPSVSQVKRAILGLRSAPSQPSLTATPKQEGDAAGARHLDRPGHHTPRESLLRRLSWLVPVPEGTPLHPEGAQGDQSLRLMVPFERLASPDPKAAAKAVAAPGTPGDEAPASRPDSGEAGEDDYIKMIHEVVRSQSKHRAPGTLTRAQSGMTPDTTLRPVDMDVIRYGRRRHALRWSKKQVDTVKRIWESIDLDRDQTVTRAELELFLESGLTEEFAAGGDAEAGDGHTEGVGIGLGRLLVKSGLGRRQHIHFRDMVKVFFTGGLMKSPHITERDIDEIVEYAYPRVPPPPPLTEEQEMLLRVLWNLWRQDSNQAFITLDDMIKSQPEVEPKLVRVLFRKIDAGGRGKVSYGDLRTWFGKEHAKRHVESAQRHSTALMGIQAALESYRKNQYGRQPGRKKLFK